MIFGEKDYASAANHAYHVIVALQAAPEDPRVREAYGIFNGGARKIKQDTGSTDPLHQRILRHEKEVKELALMNFGRADPENIK